jgi:hypothetical protein
MGNGRSVRFGSKGGAGIFMLIFGWVFMWGWCGAVEIDGTRYEASCACDPVRILVEHTPAPGHKP